MKLAELSVGDRRDATVVEDLSRTQIVMYAGASGDYNPLHTDEVYATKAAGYPSVIAHGQLTMGLTAKVITDWIEDGELTGLGVRFRRQVWPGDTLTATATVTATEDPDEGGLRIVELDVSTVNQDGEPVMAGYARLQERR
ncbi:MULTISPECIES: MaoC family dehydratase [Mycolicibacterium]|uniref:MaoC-like dehydratase n=2 Tax=Mycolicibacterium TaxID=1866885 RepID=A0AAD1H564_9MYCO|nr:MULTISPECIES: MaoC/PaaZ C-terminal domain-containing protein [Mycolicibacterium]MCV7042484.1 MaoC family dehydratase N-terminal domain-containing protein [Mycolicibacterium moriokaense]MCV7057771.1 MaoC family dehydratase N-terminal domain-containing protein [Mycolicibacterium gilvum]ORB14081.1 acyl dehydratase [Mycolicibacterium moriokaense]STZ41111.1 MaoC like domain-containing protein [Mycolicibacterium gilvum]BBW99157.1 MaoC-like dehydratase [Mycolicibacterium moriokaense]